MDRVEVDMLVVRREDLSKGACEGNILDSRRG
jgi:hypothetical protein